MAETRTKFPPEEFTEDEEAAIVGRFVMTPKAKKDPAGAGDEGREKAAPYGTVYVREEPEESDTEPEPDEPAEEESEEESEDEEPAEEEEGEEEVPVDSLTVEELKDELDAWGVEYSHSDRKADLQVKLTEARAAG